MLREVLTMEGFDVLPILNIKEDFLQLIDLHRPHVVVLDYRLDGEISKQNCFKIKKQFPQPVIALSSNYNIDRLYGEGGLDDYIRKPFNLDKLYSIIKKYIPDSKK